MRLTTSGRGGEVVRWKMATGEYGPEYTKYKEAVVGKRLPKPQGRPPEAPSPRPQARPQGPGEPPGGPPEKAGLIFFLAVPRS